MPAYQAEKTIRESMESVLAQTFANWELIIVFDKSTDKTEEIIHSFCEKDARITSYTQREKLGVAGARNLGIANAKGEWVAFLDSDDLWLSDKLEKQLRFMYEKNADISYTSTAYIMNNLRSRYVLRAKPKLSYNMLMKQNIMSCSSVIVRRQIAERNPFFQGQSIKDFAEDYAVWLKILRDEAPVAHGLDEPLLIYRMSRNSRGGKLSRVGVMVFYTYRHVGYGVFSSLLFTMRYSIRSVFKRFFITAAWETETEATA
jgi:glycosyltransferase involved in cell wall biosynthesis